MEDVKKNATYPCRNDISVVSLMFGTGLVAGVACGILFMSLCLIYVRRRRSERIMAAAAAARHAAIELRCVVGVPAVEVLGTPEHPV